MSPSDKVWGSTVEFGTTRQSQFKPQSHRLSQNTGCHIPFPSVILGLHTFCSLLPMNNRGMYVFLKQFYKYYFRIIVISIQSDTLQTHCSFVTFFLYMYTIHLSSSTSRVFLPSLNVRAHSTGEKCLR